jgi:hypothetical protein
MRSCSKAYLCIAAMGALGGGAAVALATRVIPKLSTRLKSRMMRKMMAGMCASGCGPAASGGCGPHPGHEGGDEQPECAAATSSSRCGPSAAPAAPVVV